MDALDNKLNILKRQAGKRKIKIMILALGSVGNYLLDYLLSAKDENMELYVVGRDAEKMQSDVNIVRVAARIRGENRSRVTIAGGVDFNHISDIADVIGTYQPDIIVNSSRAYSGLKYGSISWPHMRAYGIWTPLAIKFIRNIMKAYEMAKSNAIVIHTSYSDAVIPWLKSAGSAYPDFGSGNINHLIPRFQFAIAKELEISDDWNIDLTLAASHFHDVVISKEGHTENVDLLLEARYKGKKLDLNLDEIIRNCSILMPTDKKRNMMNASSNFEIIQTILAAVRQGRKTKLHCPGVFGEIGGYPVIIDGSKEPVHACICEDTFSLAQMRAKNRESIYLDGIENIADGTLTYTEELLFKVKRAFGVALPKQVAFEEIDETADFIIKQIIEPSIR